jgi:hypothetical protein
VGYFVLWLVHVAMVASIWHRFSWNDEFGTTFRVLSFISAAGYTWWLLKPKSKHFSNPNSLASAKDAARLARFPIVPLSMAQQ